VGISLAGAASPALGTPVSIGLPTTNGVAFNGSNVFQFISEYGAVKTISQPQVTVMSGSSARFRVADTQNYVSEITRSVDDGAVTVSTSTDSVDTGFTFDIAASWDSATVYGNIDILLQEVRSIDTFDDNPDAIVQLPQTTERELSTQVRIRPGDSLLIAGLVREIDNFSKEGPGIQEPIFPSSRTAQTSNVELVFLLRPRVIIYTTPTSRQLENLRAESARQLQRSTQAFIDKVDMAKQRVSSVPLAQPITEVAPIKKTPPLEEYKPLPIIVNDRPEKPIGNPLPEIKIIEEDYVPVRPVFSH
ncbi:MAG: hypothetical protein JKY11_00930, partial [Alphaproteobacteria bacterium]|nr:hypothetical protein [Alphaproteobacteria bacterium]